MSRVNAFEEQMRQLTPEKLAELQLPVPVAKPGRSLFLLWKVEAGGGSRRTAAHGTPSAQQRKKAVSAIGQRAAPL